ncbi:MAG: hypothetical protein Q8P31_06375 [Bacillota bacterium]|nr:hypothetical protein [Bacillota bacterium]
MAALPSGRLAAHSRPVAISGRRNRHTLERVGTAPDAGSAGRLRKERLATAKAKTASTVIPATHSTTPSAEPCIQFRPPRSSEKPQTVASLRNTPIDMKCVCLRSIRMLCDTLRHAHMSGSGRPYVITAVISVERRAGAPKTPW